MIFVIKIFYGEGDLFRVAPYRFMLVLDKDELFHYDRNFLQESLLDIMFS